jgi:outer membrane protein, heavy metal efflux system
VNRSFLLAFALLAVPAATLVRAQGPFPTATRLPPVSQAAHQEEILPAPRPDDFHVPNTPALSLPAIEQMALANHPALAAAAARIDAAQGRWVQAGLKPNPVIGYSGMEIGNQGTAGAQGGFVSQRVITGKKLQLDQAMAEWEATAAQFQLTAQEQRVLSDVRARFYDALVAQRRVELTAQLARIGDDLVDSTDKLLQARLGTENDLLQAQIRADQARLLHDNARNQRTEAWRRLAAVTGLPELRESSLAGELDTGLPNFDWQQCQAMVLENHPQLGAAYARVERAAVAIERARKENVPDVDLFVGVFHNNVSSDDMANVRIGFPIPIRNQNQGAIHAAEAEWIVASQEARRIELDLRDRLAVAFRRCANARQSVDAYRERIVPRSDRSLKLVTDGYAKRQVEYLTLLTAQQTFYEANLAYLDALRELWNAATILEGQLLTGSLAEGR